MTWRSYVQFILLMVVMLLLVPLASSFPDGLEHVAEQLAFDHQVRDTAVGLLPGYELPGWGDSSVGTVLVACVGVIAVTALLVLTARLMIRKRGTVR